MCIRDRLRFARARANLKFFETLTTPFHQREGVSAAPEPQNLGRSAVMNCEHMHGKDG